MPLDPIHKDKGGSQDNPLLYKIVQKRVYVFLSLIFWRFRIA